MDDCEMRECTFAPEILQSSKIFAESKRRRSSCGGMKHFEYLYSQRNKPRKIEGYVSKEEKELKECTFKPKTNSRPLSSKRNTSMIRGFSQTIERLRKAASERELVTDFRESLRKSAPLALGKPTEVRPFTFQLDKRVRNKPLLYMDVNLGPGKTGRIGIHENDDPRVLARNFAQSYTLDLNLTKKLEDLIRQNMMQNRIPSIYINSKSASYSSKSVISKESINDFDSSTKSISEEQSRSSSREFTHNDGSVAEATENKENEKIYISRDREQYDRDDMFRRRLSLIGGSASERHTPSNILAQNPKSKICVQSATEKLRHNLDQMEEFTKMASSEKFDEDYDSIVIIPDD